MNADGQPELAVDVTAGVRSGLAVPLAIGLVVGGALLLALAVTLIVVGARAGTGPRPERDRGPLPAPSPLPPPSAPVATIAAGPSTGAQRIAGEEAVPTAHPVRYSAALDDGLSRWMWLVKWILAIPHLIVLIVLWIAFVVLTIAAWFAIVATGRYPRSIFDVNVGVLRWTWRVTHYASTGGLGTDRYPPFTLEAQADDAVRLDVDYPTQLSRWLPFVKVILAIPHLVIVALLTGSTIRWFGADGIGWGVAGGGGLLGLLVLIAGIVLLVTGSYPTALYDLIAGLNRWIVRVVAYVALMTDEYPPFRLDQGPDEPASPSGPTPPSTPATSGPGTDASWVFVEPSAAETSRASEPSQT